MLILSASVLLKITIVINASFFSTNVKSIRGVVLAKVTPPVTSNPVVPGVGDLLEQSQLLTLVA